MVWHRLKWVLAVLIVCALVTSFGVVYGLFEDSQSGGDDKLQAFFPPLTNPNNSVCVELQIVQFSTTQGVTLALTLDPDKSTSSEVFNEAGSRLTQNVHLWVAGKQITFANNSVVGVWQQVPVPLSSSRLMRYPFDDYSADLWLSLWTGANEETSEVDLTVYVETPHAPGYRYSLKSSEGGGDGLQHLQLSILRDPLFQVYPIFLIVAFWLIIIVATTMLILVSVFGWRKVEPPHLALAGALLFAVPALRNTAPLAPPMGVLLDYCSFFWAMLMCVVLWVTFFCRYFKDSIPATSTSEKVVSSSVTPVSAPPSAPASPAPAWPSKTG